jgi:hypothetical protein
MATEFDDKGKYFTNVIAKVPFTALIQTSQHLIHGVIHVKRDERVIDELNLPESFLAVTDATVSTLEGEQLYACKFMTVNRSHIVWLIPETEITSEQRKFQ